MNLPLRLFWVIVAARFRTPVPALGPCITPFRCLPTDLDVLKHMNNGKYLSILDVARLDLMIRGRIAALLSRQGWYPVVAAETIRFRKSLQLFQSFLVETSVIGWDDKAFIVQQRFWRNDVCVAEAVVRARVLKRTGGSVAPEEVLRLAALATESAALPEWIREWNARQSD
jgi:acyl-CoA thioesterase FadM